MNWALQEAKNKLSEVIDKSITDGPQVITKHGKEVVVILPIKDFKQMKSQKCDLVDFFRKSPLVGKLNLNRDPDCTLREINL